MSAAASEPDAEEADPWSSELLSDDEVEVEGWVAAGAEAFDACGGAPCVPDAGEAFAGLAVPAALFDFGVVCGVGAGLAAALFAGVVSMLVCSTSEKPCDGAFAGADFAAGAGWGPDIISKIARAMNRAACA